MKNTSLDMKGFTLSELMIVVSIFGLLVAIGITSATGYMKSSRLIGATNTLIADLYFTRSLATSQQKVYQIAFSGNEYKIFRVSPADTVRTREMPDGVACAASDTATFYGWGLTEPVSITLNGSSTTKTVQLSVNGSVTHD